MTIQRYEPAFRDYNMALTMEPLDGGSWVLYTDHLAAMQRERIEGQIAVLEEMMDRMKAHLGLLQNAEVRYAYELLRDRRDALRKELGE